MLNISQRQIVDVNTACPTTGLVQRKHGLNQDQPACFARSIEVTSDDDARSEKPPKELGKTRRYLRDQAGTKTASKLVAFRCVCKG